MRILNADDAPLDASAMARKKKHPEHENHERWLVSYADFITLLFAFFVVMFAVSQVEPFCERSR